MTPEFRTQLLGSLRANRALNAERYAPSYGEVVCVCAVPDADPRRDHGMCAICKRKPLALMKQVAS